MKKEQRTTGHSEAKESAGQARTLVVNRDGPMVIRFPHSQGTAPVIPPGIKFDRSTTPRQGKPIPTN